MPFLHIRSLPFPEPRDTRELIEGIRQDVARLAGIVPEQISVTWTFLSHDHPAVAGLAMALQPLVTHPVLAELRVTDGTEPTPHAEALLKATTAGIAQRSGVPEEHVFVAYRPTTADTDTDFDTRSIARW